jgi:hypothetical protein
VGTMRQLGPNVCKGVVQSLQRKVLVSGIAEA